jgi:hypothetical protein
MIVSRELRTGVIVSEHNKEKLPRVFEEALGQGKVEVIDEVLHPDFVIYDPNSEAGQIRGGRNHEGGD